KNVKGYYGECFSKKNLIILSTKLAKYDLKYILSVIYHECAHFKYQNHQKEFYDYLEERYPNYQKVQRELRKIRYNEKY
ncbi:MAG: M48 family metallopeptidase, partial [Roseburia sp.]|nr:M48 family metallopeptidase [Roseburia sp.]